MGRITVAELWCDGLGLYAMWLYDAITGGRDLSTGHDEDFVWMERESFGTWFYRSTVILLWERGADSYDSAIRGF